MTTRSGDWKSRFSKECNELNITLNYTLCNQYT